MRALVFDSKLEFRAGYPDPIPAAGESIIRVSLAGICGTDLEIARGYMNFRGVPGHEFVGVVTETSNPDLRGRRVVGEINAGCGRCEMCAAQLTRHCSNRTVLGILGRDGAFAQYLALPDRNLIPVPDTLPDDAAVFTEPIAAAYEIFEQTYPPRNQSILVMGDGRLGTLVAMMLRGEGYTPQIAGHHRKKLSRLTQFGLRAVPEAEIDGRFDLVIDCTGQSAGFSRAIDLVKPRGTIILKSTAAGSEPMNLAPVVINEITVLGSRCGRFAPALDALQAGKFDPRALIDGTFALEDGLAAFAAARDPLNFKILLRAS